MTTPIRTHDDAIRVLRETLPGIVDLEIFEFRAPSGRKSLDIPPRPEVRGWSCRVPRLGKHGAVIAGAWVLPTTAEEIARDARTEVDKAIAKRDREFVHERPLEEDAA